MKKKRRKKEKGTRFCGLRRHIFLTIKVHRDPVRTHAQPRVIAGAADATATAERKSTEINTRACKRAR